MPWRTAMTSKEALVFDVNSGMSIAEAAERHGVARSCAYKWVDRYRQAGGVSGLEERSRRPEHSPNATPQKLIDELLALKRRHPEFGPAKLVNLLEERHGGHVIAVSTAGTILSRRGKVIRRASRRNVGRMEHRPYDISGAGDTQTADFKGQFRMGNGGLCFPLTIADPVSRFLLAMIALPSTHMKPVRAAFERVFREYGVPRQIVTDNGTPFCSANSLGGLTQLSRWWIELGIVPARIAPGRPDQNAVHERMHRTFKDWIVRHRRDDLRGHQRSFNAFREKFNHVRPHEALGQKKPVSSFKHYRPFPTKSTIEYDSTMEVRKVNANGEIKWFGDLIFTSETLVGANVGLLQIGEQLHSIYFGTVRIGYLDARSRRATNRKPDKDQHG